MEATLHKLKTTGLHCLVMAQPYVEIARNEPKGLRMQGMCTTMKLWPGRFPFYQRHKAEQEHSLAARNSQHSQVLHITLSKLSTGKLLQAHHKTFLGFPHDPGQLPVAEMCWES